MNDQKEKIDTKRTFTEDLRLLKQLSSEDSQMSVSKIFQILSKKGYEALFIILSLPFCLPITIPGFSTPFGLLLAFLALRFTFAQRLWWPEWVLKKSVSSQKVNLLVEKTIWITEHLKKVTHSRFLVLTQNPLLMRCHGITIFFLSLVLLLPLPIPFSNTLTALPICLFGIGLLEDDGLFIILGYFVALMCILFFATLFFIGKSAIVFWSHS